MVDSELHVLSLRPAIFFKRARCFCLVAFAALLSGCAPGDQKADLGLPVKKTGTSVQSRNLGWLGGTCRPVQSVLNVNDFENPTKQVAVGGVILDEVHESGPLADSGLLPNDIIVRVDDNWLPVKTDSTLDLIGLVEDAIDRKVESTVIHFLRSKKIQHASVKLSQEPFDDGLPVSSTRMSMAANMAMDYLSSLQNDNGSFPASSEKQNAKLLSTSLAGLAFLSAEPTAAVEYQTCVKRCLAYLSKSVSDGVVDAIDPLTASYMIHCIAESEVQFSEANWLDVVAELSEALSNQQQESGRWSLEPHHPDDSVDGRGSDIVGTFVTNQVLLALGALERKGFESDANSIHRACRFLDQQTDLRIPSSLDRRTKAALSAGTAAALIAINCDRSNARLNRLIDDSLGRVADIYASPCLSWPGFVNLALLSRQIGSEAWLQFHRENKFTLISLPMPDGSVAADPLMDLQSYEFELWVDPVVWRTAHFILAQNMQNEQLDRSLALVQSSPSELRDHLGKVFMPVSKDDDETRAKQRAELTRMILEQLKQSGMDVDEADLNPAQSSANDQK